MIRRRTLFTDWTKSRVKVAARLAKIRAKLQSCVRTVWPKQNIDPERWGLFLMDVEGTEASVYMMKHGVYIPLCGKPFHHDPSSFSKLKKWQRAAALEVVYRFVR